MDCKQSDRRATRHPHRWQKRKRTISKETEETAPTEQSSAKSNASVEDATIQLNASAEDAMTQLNASAEDATTQLNASAEDAMTQLNVSTEDATAQLNASAKDTSIQKNSSAEDTSIQKNSSIQYISALKDEEVIAEFENHAPKFALRATDPRKFWNLEKLQALHLPKLTTLGKRQFSERQLLERQFLELSAEREKNIRVRDVVQRFSSVVAYNLFQTHFPFRINVSKYFVRSFLSKKGISTTEQEETYYKLLLNGEKEVHFCHELSGIKGDCRDRDTREKIDFSVLFLNVDDTIWEAKGENRSKVIQQSMELDFIEKSENLGAGLAAKRILNPQQVSLPKQPLLSHEEGQNNTATGPKRSRFEAGLDGTITPNHKCKKDDSNAATTKRVRN